MRRKTLTLMVLSGAVFVAGYCAAPANAQESQQITCSTVGRNFECKALNAQGLDAYPYWVLHTKPAFAAYVAPSEVFKGSAPKHWTKITAQFILNDQTTKTACIKTRINKGTKSAEFDYCEVKASIPMTW